MSQSEPKVEATKDPAEVERLRLAKKLFDDSQFMAQQYKALIQHTGGLVTSSMVYAYGRGLQDAIKLILQENEKNVKKEVSNTEPA